MLAYLAIERNRLIPREEIADAIWDDALPVEWEDTLAVLLQQLRDALTNSPAGAFLRIDGAGHCALYGSDEAWVDIEAAAEAIHDAEGHLRAGRWVDAFGPSAVAHHIARRSFLRGENSRWVRSHRERLHGILVRALECRGEIFLCNGEVTQAIETAKEVVALEPFRETAYRLLIRSHNASGNVAEARRAFDRCRKLLADELGIEPSPETLATLQPVVPRSHVTPPAAITPSEVPAPIHPGAGFHAELQQLLGDAYLIERELAPGGMSRVFVARERALGRQVVIKVLPPHLVDRVSAVRFTREVQLTANLQQANIVPVLTAAIAGGLPYYTMPFIPGESLRQILLQAKTLTAARVTTILRDVARALAFAHAHGIVHRDIKPENILLSGDTAVVTDFGIAKALHSVGEDRGDLTSEHLTGTGVALGTPQYMAPEQIAADPNVDHRVDIYCFGVLAYELLAGQPPFSGRNARDALVAHIMETPPDLRRVRNDLPAALLRVVTACLEKDPEARPQSMSSVLATLGE
jgi:DNA-binding SARP family transcriptional activator/tRNA A-37 threonylcarbamoyl transferase component Bud32